MRASGNLQQLVCCPLDEFQKLIQWRANFKTCYILIWKDVLVRKPFIFGRVSFKSYCNASAKTSYILTAQIASWVAKSPEPQIKHLTHGPSQFSIS
jgi:hypothetical protein